MNKITIFREEYFFLGNFYSCKIYWAKRYWSSVEHAFQAEKTFDLSIQEKIRSSKSCKEAKRIGNNLKLREDWEEVKFPIMVELVFLKFEQNWTLRKRLLQTGDAELVEGNYWHDNYWGDCYCDKCKEIQGQNKLGKILMNERNFIKVGR